jgi:hypothetical protein
MNSPDVIVRLERGLRALDPERAKFETWCCKRWVRRLGGKTRRTYE